MSKSARDRAVEALDAALSAAQEREVDNYTAQPAVDAIIEACVEAVRENYPGVSCPSETATNLPPVRVIEDPSKVDCPLPPEPEVRIVGLPGRGHIRYLIKLGEESVPGSPTFIDCIEAAAEHTNTRRVARDGSRRRRMLRRPGHRSEHCRIRGASRSAQGPLRRASCHQGWHCVDD